jgi:hypothetical protein
MIRLTLIVAAMFAAALGKSETQHSATNANDGTLLEAQSYSFPAYDKTEEIEFYSSRPEYEGAVADK